MSLETQRQNDKVRIQQYQTLLEISEAIASNRDLASLFRNLAQHLRAVVDFDWVSTLLYDPARDVMRIHMLEPPQPDGLIGPAEMPVDDVPSGWAWKTQEPLIIQDAARETRFPQFNTWARQNGVKSYCALPLTSAGRRLGALGFASVKNVVWNKDDLEFLTQVARQVAVAIDNAINNAINAAHDASGGADIIIKWRLHNVTGESGGITGLDILNVTIQTLGPETSSS